MANYRKVCWTDADVICPFYRTDDREQRTICCEGFADRTRTISKFASLRQRDRHMGTYCVEKYQSCPVYRCTYESKYGEG